MAKILERKIFIQIHTILDHLQWVDPAFISSMEIEDDATTVHFVPDSSFKMLRIKETPEEIIHLIRVAETKI